MKREHFYTLVIIVLLLLNIGTLAFLWVSKSDNRRPVPQGRPGGVLIEELQMNEQQQREFSHFRNVHRRATDSVQRQIKEAQRALFGLVKKDDMDIEVRDSLLGRIERYESAKHLITIQHFHDIRSILDEEQKMLFNDFIEDIGSQLNGHPPPHRGGPPPPRH